MPLVTHAPLDLAESVPHFWHISQQARILLSYVILKIFEYYDYLYSAISKNTLLLALAHHSTDSIVSGFKGLRP